LAEPALRAGTVLARRFALAFSCVLAFWIGALCVGGPGGAARAIGEAGGPLPEPRRDGEVAVERALALRRSVREFGPEPLPLSAVSQLLWAAQGVTHPDGLRTAPSAGALYPLEVYLVAGAVLGIDPGVYRYDPRRHRLSLQSEGDARAGVAEAALDQEWVAEAPAIIVLAAVYERTGRKYGHRAERYVHMEAGHAAQNVYLQAAALGLGTTMVGAFRDEQLVRVLRLPKHTEPLGLLPVGTPRR
jgi:SagB-type dehydrogenase family enzyme